MCLRQRDFRVGSRDVQLGEVGGCPVYAAPDGAVCWADWQVTLDVVDAGGDSFSLEAADGVRFIARSTLPGPAA